jgi:hypothetical protein
MTTLSCANTNTRVFIMTLALSKAFASTYPASTRFRFFIQDWGGSDRLASIREERANQRHKTDDFGWHSKIRRNDHGYFSSLSRNQYA